MEHKSRRKSSFYPKHLLNEHKIIESKNNLDNNLLSKYKIDDSEKKLQDFWKSKLEAMEKIYLDDECFAEDEIETKKINQAKNIFPKSEHSTNRKSSNSPKKKTKKNHSRKKSENKNNNKNMIIHHDGTIEKNKMESKDLVNVINFDNNKELKKRI